MFKAQAIYCSLKRVFGTHVLKLYVVPVCSFHLKHKFDYFRDHRLGPIFSDDGFKQKGGLLTREFHVSYKNNCVSLHKNGLNGEAENNIQKELVEDIFNSCCEIDIFFQSDGLDITSKVVTASQNCGLSAEQIRRIFKKSPTLIKKCNIKSIFDLLQELGFTKNEITKIFVDQSRILKFDKSKVLDVFETLSTVGLPNNCVLNAIKSQPEILFMSPKEIKENVYSMGELFSLKQIITVLNKMPFILLEEPDKVIEKCMYAKDIMVTDMEQITSSSLLRHSMHSIRCRHMFLKRAGLFKKFKQKKGEPNQNPPLKDIMDPTDEIFLKNFMPNATILDYKTFCNLLEEEFNSNSQDIDDIENIED